MRKRIALIFALMPMFAFGQTLLTNKLSGNISSFNLAGRTNIQMTLQISSPLNRYIGSIFISNDPLITRSDTNGNFAFTNVQWGKYILRPSDSAGSTWYPTVGTNTTGDWTMSSLCQAGSVLPPNPATNYYTMAQVDAMVRGGGGESNYNRTIGGGEVLDAGKDGPTNLLKSLNVSGGATIASTSSNITVNVNANVAFATNADHSAASDSAATATSAQLLTAGVFGQYSFDGGWVPSTDVKMESFDLATYYDNSGFHTTTNIDAGHAIGNFTNQFDASGAAAAAQAAAIAATVATNTAIRTSITQASNALLVDISAKANTNSPTIRNAKNSGSFELSPTNYPSFTSGTNEGIANPYAAQGSFRSQESITRSYFGSQSQFTQSGNGIGQSPYDWNLLGGSVVTSYHPALGGSAATLADIPLISESVQNNQRVPYIVFSSVGTAGYTDNAVITNCNESYVMTQVSNIVAANFLPTLSSNGIFAAYDLDGGALTNHRSAIFQLQWNTNRWPSGTVNPTNIAYRFHTNALELWMMLPYDCFAPNYPDTELDIPTSPSGQYRDPNSYSLNAFWNYPSGSNPFNPALANYEINPITGPDKIHMDVDTLYSWNVDGVSWQGPSIVAHGSMQQEWLGISYAATYPANDTSSLFVQANRYWNSYFTNRMNSHGLIVNYMYDSNGKPPYAPDLVSIANGVVIGSNSGSTEIANSVLCGIVSNFRLQLPSIASSKANWHLCMQQDNMYGMATAWTAYKDWKNYFSACSMLSANVWICSPSSNYVATANFRTQITNQNFMSLLADVSHKPAIVNLGATNSIITKQLSDGRFAVWMINENQSQATNLTINLNALVGGTNVFCKITDLWTNSVLATAQGSYTRTIAADSTELMYVMPSAKLSIQIPFVSTTNNTTGTNVLLTTLAAGSYDLRGTMAARTASSTGGIIGYIYTTNANASVNACVSANASSATDPGLDSAGPRYYLDAWGPAAQFQSTTDPFTGCTTLFYGIADGRKCFVTTGMGKFTLTNSTELRLWLRQFNATDVANAATTSTNAWVVIEGPNP